MWTRQTTSPSSAVTSFTASPAVHAINAKSDAYEAEVLARLLRGRNLPMAYAYPLERRGLRDLLRTRPRLVRQWAELYGHVHTARRRLNLTPKGSGMNYHSKRDAAATRNVLRSHRRMALTSPQAAE